MKIKMLLALAGLLIVSMVVVSPGFAQSVTYQAFGTIDEYDPESTEFAQIVGGFWRIKIEDDTVDFKAFYVELNVGEQIPGTYDLFFRVVLADATIESIDGSNCEVEGTLVLYKIGFHPETGEFGFYIISFGTRIVIDSSEIRIDLPGLPNQYIEGTTLFVDS